MGPHSKHVLLSAPGSDTTSLATDAEFGNSLKKAASLSFAIDVATDAILLQPDFEHLKGADDLQKHQNESKATATTWKTDVRSALFSIIDAVLAYNSQFSAFYDDLYKLAEQMGTDDKARSDLVLGLNELKKQVTLQKNKITDVAGKLNQFHSTMKDHQGKLTVDFNTISNMYESKKGIIAQLNEAVDALNHAMAKDLGQMALGAGAIVAGILAVAVGVGFWLESGGTSTPVIVAGIVAIAGTAGGTAAIATGAADYSSSARKKADMLNQISGIDSDLAAAKHLESGVTHLITSVSAASDAANLLSEKWSVLERDYDNVITALQSTQDGAQLSFIVKDHLRAAKDQWDGLEKDAKAIKENFLQPVNVDTSALEKGEHGKTFSLPITSTFAAPAYTRIAAAVVAPPPVPEKNLRLKLWVDETSRELLQFGQSLQSTIVAGNTPNSVVTVCDHLKGTGNAAFQAATDFIKTIQDLSKYSAILMHTAELPDNAIVADGLKVFSDLSSQLNTCKKFGNSALTKIGDMDITLMTTNSAINEWILTLKNDLQTDKDQIAYFDKLKTEAEAEKERSKNDYWWCFLGPIACAVVAIEQSQKVSSANAKIGLYNEELSKTNSKLSQVVVVWQHADELGRQLVITKMLNINSFGR